MSYDINNLKRRAERGNAMMELVICLVPYLLILMGAMFVSGISMGKQEIVKYSTSEIRPGSGTLDPDKFFGHLSGKATVESANSYEPSDESDFNSLARVEDSDEPVLPYDANGDDIARAIDVSGTSLHFDMEQGGYVIQRGQSGSRLEGLGFLDKTNGEVYQDGDDIEQEIGQMELVVNVSEALGNWITYRGATAKYKYTLPFNSVLPGEDSSVKNASWRSNAGVTVNLSFSRRYFWPVVEDPFYHDSNSFSDLSNVIAALYDMSPEQLTAYTFGNLSSYTLDISGN